MFKFALYEKTEKHIYQLTEVEYTKTNIRAMEVFLNSCNAGRRLKQETLGAILLSREV